MYDLIVIGGGAAGLFAALSAKSANPSANVALLEKSAVLLAKVRVSGGGRCNVTHACFDPAQLTQNYPRGFNELRGPLHRFQPSDTIQWFESRGVPLKAEKDGRVFPISDNSQSIIDCLLSEAQKLGVEIHMRQRIATIAKTEGGFTVGPFTCRRLILATGSSVEGHAWAESLGHTIQKPVPSLFTFNVPTSPLKDLSGISVEEVEMQIVGTALKQKGPLLITHFGFSGPAALKLSAWGARHFNEKQYQVELALNWLPQLTLNQILEQLAYSKKSAPQHPLQNIFHLPKNLWKALLNDERRLNDFSTKELQALAQKLHADIYVVNGKTTHKEEFVTCGGVTLKEVNFKTMESKICPGLYFAGEILDIDGVTGGFNFQNAWTSGFIAGASSAGEV
ncbi:MAG TPA: NAD(P)/FAD-dependent oxidoreductase [Chlamydiales bacterium]|nr:NAD(P)/FAD-dependent oxidoreductase [Chlamydiales bacterium]